MDWLKNVSKFKINELFERFDMISISYVRYNDLDIKIIVITNLGNVITLKCYLETNIDTGENIYRVYDRKYL